MEEGQPLYISMEGLCESSSQSEDEEDIQTEEKQKKRLSRKSKDDFFPDCESDSCGEKENGPPAFNDPMSEDKIVALSKKQLNRLAAMEIYPIPSGGIGTVNASLFNPVTIKWLMKNFETVDGSSLPRYLVYNHYLLHCKSLNIKPINAASFGKVIRSVFLGLQTRRLGTRGNSKYHYCGMRIKPDSPLLHVIIGDTEIRKSKSGSNGTLDRGILSNSNCARDKRMNWTTKSFETWNSKFCQGLEMDYVQFRFQQEQNHNTMKHLKPDLDIFIPVTDGLTKEDIAIFKRYYHDHCNSLLASVVSFKLEQVGWTWQVFYKAEKNPKLTGAPEETNTKIDPMRPPFTRSKLKKFVVNRNVQKFINEMDKQTYTSIAYLLCPHVTVVVPCEVNQTIRNFLAIVEEWLFDALDSYPEDFRTLKIKTLQNVMRPLEQTLNTNSLYSSLQKNFSNAEKVNGLLACVDQINFEALNLMLGWKSETIAFTQVKELQAILGKPNRLPLIVQWVENLVEESLAAKVPTTEFKMNLQNTFLGLSFYMSFIKSELLLTCRDSMEHFSIVENFILEYLKYFMHLRTGMQNLVSSALASATCNEEIVDASKATGETQSKVNDLFASEDEVVDDRKHLIKLESGPPKGIDETLEDLANDDELEALEQFLASELDSFDDFGSNINLSLTDNDLMTPDEFDETFRKYFSSSGYVTNYLCQKFVASSEDDTETSDEEDCSKELHDEGVSGS